LQFGCLVDHMSIPVGCRSARPHHKAETPRCLRRDLAAVAEPAEVALCAKKQVNQPILVG
jgi:hypothetical protein